MVKVGDYKIENLYQGGYSSLDPSQNLSPIPNPISAKDLGMSTDARTANIIKQASQNLSAGATTIEINQVFPEVFDAVPKEQLEETRRLANLLGVDITFHAPVVEPSGMTQQGFTEANREAVERQMMQAIQKAALLKPDGNIPVTFHSSATVPGTIIPKADGKEKKPEETYVINSYSGEIHKIPIKQRTWPGEKEATPQKEIQQINEDVWSSKLTNLGYHLQWGSRYLEEAKQIGDEDASITKKIGKNYLVDSYRQLKELYNMAYISAEKNGNKRDIEVLNNLYKNIKKDAESIKKDPHDDRNLQRMQKILQEGLTTFEKLSAPPKVFKPIDEFAEEKTVETFSNLAVNTYNDFIKKGKKAPIISIENPPIGGAFSTGDDLKRIVEKTREEFINKIIKQGVPKEEAKKQAEQLIGVTWDVGHINMLRKHGYSERDIIEQTDKIAPLVKHVHLSDNFGMEHTELPMGMGNVPIKEMMKKLGEKGFEGKKIIEAMHWWQHFSEGGKIPPLQPTLEAFGSPVYSEGVGPYWNQIVGFQQGYFSGYGMMLPQVNYNTWGAGFSMASLPIELGGQMPGQDGSRMSGRPME